MPTQTSRHRCAAAAICLATFAFVAVANAQTVTWGVNGVGGSGDWNTSNVNWYNGTSNVAWPNEGNAIFAGASGGAVNSFYFGPVVSSMTFNTPGYVIQGGWVKSGSGGLTVTTNVDAKISSTLSNSGSAGNFLIKDGPAALSIGGTNFMRSVQVDEGELRVVDGSTLFFSDVTLANAPGATVALAQNSTTVEMRSLSGGGTLGGVVHPSGQGGMVTLTVLDGGTFNGRLENGGGTILGMSIFADDATPQILTNANTYFGGTSVLGALDFAGNGSAVNSSMTVYGDLLLDNSGTVVANRISDSALFALKNGTVHLQGNTATAVEEVLGPLSVFGASSISVVQPGSATAELTFAGLARSSHATLNVSGPGVTFAGASNGSTGILSPYITADNEWATVAADSHIMPWNNYAADINAGSTADHVKITASGTTSLAAATTRASLNLQNANAVTDQVLDLVGQNLQLTTGGILSSGAGASAILSGTLSTPTQEIVVTANNNLAINSVIVDSAGSTTLTKSGTGVLTLTGANTYTGPTAIMQGTLVVASDANLGLGSVIDLGGATLRAAADFSSAKSIQNSSSSLGSIDTAGFNVTLSGANSGGLIKTGPGTLTLTNPSTGRTTVTEGVLDLANATSGSASLQGGTLEASGFLSSLESFAIASHALDLGGMAAATLTTGVYLTSSIGSLQINFGLGSGGSDFWAISFLGGVFPSNSGAFQFEFQNLGGVTTGVDYPLMSFPYTGFAPSATVFAFAPDMAAAGWAGTFQPTTTGVSVRFTSVPEPEATALLLLQGAVLAFVAGRRLRTGMRAPARRACG